MKVTVDIDCTPEEARRFMGLPDVSELHRQYLDKMAEMMQQGAGAELFQMWSTAGMAGLEQWQKFVASFDDSHAGSGKKGK